MVPLANDPPHAVAIGPSLFGAEAERIATNIVDLTRTLATSTPTPRGYPYFGLDAPYPQSIPLLDRLATSGIFRKYEHVLQLGAALGSAARWLALCRGCRVVGVTATRSEAAGARVLTRRADLGGQVEVLVAQSTRLPLHGGRFTHVWSVGALGPVRDPTPTLREAFRAVRPGGLFSAQELVRAEPPSPPSNDVPGDGLTPACTIAEYADALVAAGFINVRTEDVTTAPAEPSLTIEKARATLTKRMEGAGDGSSEYLRNLKSLESLQEKQRQGHYRLYHVTAARP